MFFTVIYGDKFFNYLKLILVNVFGMKVVEEVEYQLLQKVKSSKMMQLHSLSICSTMSEMPVKLHCTAVNHKLKCWMACLNINHKLKCWMACLNIIGNPLIYQCLKLFTVGVDSKPSVLEHMHFYRECIFLINDKKVISKNQCVKHKTASLINFKSDSKIRNKCIIAITFCAASYMLFFFINQVRKWEKSLQQVFGETNVDKLKSEAKEELNKYFASLPKPSKLDFISRDII